MEASLPESGRLFGGVACCDHPSGLRWTDGVKRLTEGANALWLLNVIAILQRRALRDPWLREFQLWELFKIPDRRVVIACSHDSEQVAFRLAMGRMDVSLDYARLYVTRGIVSLPREHHRALFS